MAISYEKFTAMAAHDDAAADKYWRSGQGITLSTSTLATAIEGLTSLDLTGGRKAQYARQGKELFSTGKTRLKATMLKDLTSRFTRDAPDNPPVSTYAVSVAVVGVAIAAVALGIVVGNLAEDYFNDGDGGSASGGTTVTASSSGEGDVDVNIGNSGNE